jgi:hypothetical protein
LFSLQEKQEAKFGTMVHRLLAEVEWGHASVEMVEVWLKRGEPEDVVREVKSVLEADALRLIWRQPEAVAKAEVWREKAFYDFKTTRVAGLDLRAMVTRYAEQLSLYRNVVAVLTDLPPNKVSAEVVFTQLAQAMVLDLPD